MTPRRIILLVGHQEEQLGPRRFFLETRGFRVLTATTLRDALNAVVRNDVRVAVVDLEFEEGNGVQLGLSLVTMLREWSADVRTVLVTRVDKGIAHPAEALLFAGPQLNFELIERVRVLSGRKRGPRRVEGAIRVVAAGGVVCAS